MNDFVKISQWVFEIEQALKGRSLRVAQIEARVAKKLARMALEVTSQEDFTVTQDKLEALKRLNRYARMLEADDASEEALAQIEGDVDKLYGDQAQNSTYYFGRKDAGALEEMEALTTYQPPVYEWNTDVTPEDGVRTTLGFEEDGDWIDSDDMLDLDMAGPYQSFGPKKPLNDRTPDEF